MNKKSINIILITIICCILMAIIETIIEPIYIIKSLLKVLIFLILPLIFIIKTKDTIKDNFKITKHNMLNLLLLGMSVYVLILISYFIATKFIDFNSLINTLTVDQKVNSKNCVLIILYISFFNSLLEEFLFRLFSFIKLSKYTNKKTAYLFSSIMFAIYHISMVGKAFPLPLMIISLIGLTLGGLVFDYLDYKNKSIYNSWTIHIFADLSLMTIWLIHLL